MFQRKQNVEFMQWFYGGRGKAQGPSTVRSTIRCTSEPHKPGFSMTYCMHTARLMEKQLRSEGAFNMRPTKKHANNNSKNIMILSQQPRCSVPTHAVTSALDSKKRSKQSWSLTVAAFYCAYVAISTSTTNPCSPVAAAVASFEMKPGRSAHNHMTRLRIGTRSRSRRYAWPFSPAVQTTPTWQAILPRPVPLGLVAQTPSAWRAFPCGLHVPRKESDWEKQWSKREGKDRAKSW